MEVSAVNPVRFFVVTRVLASTITIPLLSFYSWWQWLGYFWMFRQTKTPVFQHFSNKLSIILFFSTANIKTVSYGFTIEIVGCYKGYNSSNGTLGVGKAANASVVMSMFLIFIEEVFIVQETNWFRWKSTAKICFTLRGWNITELLMLRTITLKALNRYCRPFE